MACKKWRERFFRNIALIHFGDSAVLDDLLIGQIPSGVDSSQQDGPAVVLQMKSDIGE
jgi:hypothetical protein